MRIVQLLASVFVGGPERQVLGVAATLAPAVETVFLSFPERGRARTFLGEARRQGFASILLHHNYPRLWAAAQEIAGHIRRLDADVLCCNGYKPDIVGCLAARLAGVPVVAIAHGWTAATVKVRLNEALDRRVLRWMDATVCVSHAQAAALRRAGMATERIHVIHNAIDASDVPGGDPEYRAQLRAFFPESPQLIVGAAGRLSPEKGVDVLIDAAALACREQPGLGFVIFGDGPLRTSLEQRIRGLGLTGRVVLAGFRSDVRRFLPHFDVFALSSHTEGLPVALLEAFAAGLPVVATAVGGVPEVIEDGVNGYLVPAGNPTELARRIVELGHSADRCRSFGCQAQESVRRDFALEKQAAQYRDLFETVAGHGKRARHGKPADAAVVC